MDLIVAGIGGVFVGVAIAEKLGLPLLQAYYIPFTPTRAYPAFVIPKPPSFARHTAQPPVVPGRPADDVAGVPVGRSSGAAGGVGSARGPVLRPVQLGMRAGPADPLRLQPSRHPAARGLGRRHPRDRLLVPGSGRGLDAGPGPDGVPAGRPAAGLRRLREHEQPEPGSNRQSDPGRVWRARDSVASSTPAGAACSRRICRTP